MVRDDVFGCDCDSKSTGPSGTGMISHNFFGEFVEEAVESFIRRVGQVAWIGFNCGFSLHHRAVARSLPSKFKKKMLKSSCRAAAAAEFITPKKRRLYF